MIYWYYVLFIESRVDRFLKQELKSSEPCAVRCVIVVVVIVAADDDDDHHHHHYHSYFAPSQKQEQQLEFLLTQCLEV